MKRSNNGVMDVVTIIFFGIFLFFIAFFEIVVPEIIIMVLSVVALLMLSDNKKASLIFLLMPFASILPMREIVAFFIVIELARKSFRIYTSSAVLVGIWCVLEMLVDNAYGGTIKAIVSFSLFLICATLICTNSYQATDKDFFQNTFLFGFFCASLTTVYLLAKDVSFDSERFMESRLGSMTQNPDLLNIGSNGTGLLCVISLSIILNKIIEGKGKKLLQAFLMIYFLMVGLLTQSRGYLFGLFLLLFLTLIFLNHSGKLTISKTIIICVILIIAGYLYVNLFEKSYEHFISRFTDTDDISNGRIDLNSFYIERLLNDFRGLIVGYGLEAYLGYLGGALAAHNATIEIFLSWGIIGFIVAFSWFVHVIYAQIKLCQKISAFSLISLLLFFVMVQSTRIFRTLVPMLYFSLCVVSIKSKTE